MAAVVYDDVHLRVAGEEVAPEGGVCLVADLDLDARALIGTARRLDVDPNDATVRAEARPPHVDAAAAVNADLDDGHRQAAEFSQVALVDVAVMQPLPDARSFVLAVQVDAERVQRGGQLGGQLGDGVPRGRELHRVDIGRPAPRPAQRLRNGPQPAERGPQGAEGGAAQWGGRDAASGFAEMRLRHCRPPQALVLAE